MRERLTQAELARELDRIESILQQFPRGTLAGELRSAYVAAYQRPVDARTIRRRLRDLLKRGRVSSAGLARGTRYYPAPPSAEPSPGSEMVRAATATPEPRPTPPGWADGRSTPTAWGPVKETPPAPAAEAPVLDYRLPLSNSGTEIRDLVRRNLEERSRVAYDPTFLEQYVPGESWYLPQDVRAHLRELGQTPGDTRPAGTYARDIYEHLLIDLSWASSHLEGNTYSKLDTKELIRFGREAQGKDAEEAQMILNHRAAIEMLVENAEGVGFDRFTFLTLHALLSENLVNGRQNEGVLRRRPVGIGRAAFMPLAIPQKIEEHFDLLLAKAHGIPDPFEQAFFVMVHLPYLQPFIDVNKRTSRLGANLPLIKANLCPLSFVDVPRQAYIEGTLGIYELRRVDLLRDVFIWAYERSCAQYVIVRETLGKPDPIRLHYREQLREVVQDFVRAGDPPDQSSIEGWADTHSVPAEDRTAFVASARDELLDLHAGILGRYHLRPSEFTAWAERMRGPVGPGDRRM